MKLFWQTASLLFSFAFVASWQLTPLSSYTIQVFGGLVASFLLLSLRKKDFNPFGLDHDEPWSIGILSAVILLLVISTGGISSPLFFLLYFLVFGIAFVFEPVMVFLFAIGIFVVFLPLAMKDDIFGNMLRTGSIVFLSPLGYFLSREFNERDHEDAKLDRITKAADSTTEAITKDVAEILAHGEGTLDEKEKANLNDILEEANELRKTANT